MTIRALRNSALLGLIFSLTFTSCAYAANKRTVPVTVEGTVQTAHERYVIMSGEGSVKAVPNIADVSGGVTTRARHAGDALHANSDAMAKVVVALKALGVTDKEITTTNFSFEPQYETDDKGSRDPSNRVVGYTVSNEINVTLSDLSKAGDVLDVLIEAGANDSASISFDIKDRHALEMQARAEAGRDALERAQTYARQVGAELGPVRTIREGVFSEPGGGLETVTVTAMRASTRIEAGEQSISATVTVVWALK